MQNEIPAGTKVGVLMTSKGVTAVQAAEVLAHMDGLVHVNVDGEAISVDPSQIVLPDAPAPAPEESALTSGSDDLQKLAEEFSNHITDLGLRVAAIEMLAGQVHDHELRLAALEARVEVLELKVAAYSVQSTPAPAPTADPAPAPSQNPSTQESTAVATSGETAAGI